MADLSSSEAIDAAFAAAAAGTTTRKFSAPKDDNFAKRAAVVKAREEAAQAKVAEELRLRNIARRAELDKVAAVTDPSAQLLLRAGRGWTGIQAPSSDFSELEVHRLLSSDQGGMKGNLKPNSVVGLGGLTPLHRAADGGSDGMLCTLLRAGADPNARTAFGLTALHKAARRGDTTMVRSLLDAGAEIDAADNEGFTALLRSVHYGDHCMVQVLLDEGASPDAVVVPQARLSVGAGTLTATDLAREGGSETVMRLIESRQAVKPS